MQINPINTNALIFRGARINVFPSSDNHGYFINLPDYLNTVDNHKEDVFLHASDKSTLNLCINSGDMFVNTSKTGFLSYPNKTNGEVQKDFYQAFYNAVSEIVKKDNKNANFNIVYTPGNHCFSGGDKLLYNLISSFKDLDVVWTNVDIDNSPLYSWEMNKRNSNFHIEKEIEVQDDKNPDLTHHILILGATIPSLEFYNRGLLKGTTVFDSTNKKDVNFCEEDIKNTICILKKKVERFKERNPKGVVILASHLGVNLSEIVQKKIPDIDLILSGHDHHDETSQIADTTIVSLGADNKILKSVALILDDEGNIFKKENRTYSVTENKLDNSYSKNNILREMLLTDYAKDITPLIKFKNPVLGSVLSFSDKTKYSNSYLANFLTSTIKEVINQQENIDVLGLQSSMLRGGLIDGATNSDVLNIFNGLTEELSDVCIGTITGFELAFIILENVKLNMENPARNTIIHWSDILIHRDELQYLRNSSIDVLRGADSLFVRNNKGLFEKIEFSKDYTVALPQKYLLKEDIKGAGRIRHKFASINQTYNDLFKDFLKNADYIINPEPYLETRIID